MRAGKFKSLPAYTPLRLWGFWRAAGLSVGGYGEPYAWMSQSEPDAEAESDMMYYRMMTQAPESEHEHVNAAVEALLKANSGTAQQEGFVLKQYFADNCRGDLDVTTMRDQFARKFRLKRVGLSTYYRLLNDGVQYVGRHMGLPAPR